MKMKSWKKKNTFCLLIQPRSAIMIAYPTHFFQTYNKKIQYTQTDEVENMKILQFLCLSYTLCIINI